MLDFTITIVAYNNEKDINNLLCSIERYTNPNLKKLIYIVDNSSEDNSIFKIANGYKDVVYIKTDENLGYGKANNLPIKELESLYHAVINPDIIFEEDTLSIIKDYMEKNNIKMCIPKIISPSNEMQKAYRLDITVFDLLIRMFFPRRFISRQAKHTMQEYDYTKPFKVPFAQGCFYIIETNLWKELNGFDDEFFMYLEDADLCKRVNEVANITYCPYTHVIHKWEKGSHKNIKLFRYHVISVIKYFRKWGIKWS